MSQPDPSSVVRLAIAFAALKSKPRDQSIASYLLDLQSCFPLTTKDDNNGAWRTYALELEKQLASLKAQWDADQESLSKHSRDASQAAPISDAPPPKKKSKKNPAKDQHDLEWSWEQTRADWSRFLSSQHPSSPSLVAAYASVKGVLASPNADLSQATHLTDAISRALATIRAFLFSAPNPNPGHVRTALGTPLRLGPDPQYIDCARIAMASPLLMYLLRVALPALLHILQGESTRSKRQRQRIHPAAPVSTDAHVHVDSVLDRLLERVLLPLLRALAPLCTARLAPLVTPLPKKASRPVGKAKSKDKEKDADGRTGTPSVRPPKNADVRADVFALIGASLEALDALPVLVRPSGAGGIDLVGPVAVDVRARLGLEAIRELEALYAVPSLPLPSSPKPSSESGPRRPPSEAPPAVPPRTPPLARSRPWTQPRTVAESLAKRLERLAGTREERVRTLATRDAGWFLASTLNLCVTPAPAPSGPSPSHRDLAAGGSAHSGELLREALLDRVGNLVRAMPSGEHVSGGVRVGPRLADDRTSKPTLAIDPVCRNMLLAICERAMTQLAPCT